MKQILAELNETLTARGSIVVAPDGMMIAAVVREGMDQERLSAMGAAILSGIGASLRDAQWAAFTHVEIATEQGKVILVEAGPTTYLLVLLGARLEVGPGSIEIRSAAHRIARAAEFASA